MRAVLVVDMDGAAFEEGRAAHELACILRGVAEDFEAHGDPRTWQPQELRDFNGNRVGELRIEEGEGGKSNPTPHDVNAEMLRVLRQALTMVENEARQTVVVTALRAMVARAEQAGGGRK